MKQDKMPTDKQEKGGNLLEQFNELKKKHPDALLMFRNRDFYKLYKEDAVKAGAVLGLRLGSQIFDGVKQKVKVVTFPHYDLDTYLPKLIRSGNRVAIVDRQPEQKLDKLVKEGVEAIKEKGRKPDENVQTSPITNDMAKKKQEQATQEGPARTTAKAAGGEKPAEKNRAEQENTAKAGQKNEAKVGKQPEVKDAQQTETKQETKAQRQPRPPQMVTVNGEKVTHGHAYQSKVNPADFYFTAKMDGKQLKPQKMETVDLEAFKEKQITVPQLMEKYYPTKLMPKVSEETYKNPKSIDSPEGQMKVEKFNVYKEKDEQRPDYGKYKFYTQVGDAKMSAVASREDLNAYFDRVATPNQLIEKNFGERLHMKSAYEKYQLPDGVDAAGIRVAKDREDGKWKVSVDMGDKGKTAKKKISFDDGYSLFKTKTATREQIAAKYLMPEMKGLLASPAAKVEKAASLKM